MRILLVGGSSLLTQILRPVLPSFADVSTTGLASETARKKALP
jgi:hypothetical protein